MTVNRQIYFFRITMVFEMSVMISVIVTSAYFFNKYSYCQICILGGLSEYDEMSVWVDLRGYNQDVVHLPRR